MRKNKLIRLTLICILVGLTIWVCATAFGIGSFQRNNWKLGLDLQGGVHITYNADTSASTDPAAQLAEVRNIIENRVNATGVDEPSVTVEGNSISVQLPGIHTKEQVAEIQGLIGQTAELDFREMAISDSGQTTLITATSAGDTILAVADASKFTVGDSIGLERPDPTDPDRIISDDGLIESVDTENNIITFAPALENIWPIAHQVKKWIPATGLIGPVPTQLTGKHFAPESRAVLQPTQGGGTDIIVSFKVQGDGVELLKEITTRLLKKRLGAFLDNEVISAATVIDILDEGEGRITGLSRDEAVRLAIQLNQGALPIPLEQDTYYFVSGSLGADSLNKSLLAGGIGLALVLIFMIAYYRLPGLLASVSLIIYVLIVLSIFKLVPITLTLGGIAALILSIGMAVDANVLIFERLREEIRFGRTVGAAIEAGFDRAWTSIRDSNISTIITCIILYWFGNTLGTTIVMGFALSLLIGVLVSMFTAILITKSLLWLFIGTKIAKKTGLFFGGSRQQE
ncbi:protein translocase subunit SecD [Chloroflexota bacterium]